MGVFKRHITLGGMGIGLTLLSMFSGRFPDWLQDTGLTFGITLILAAVLVEAWGRLKKSQMKRERRMPFDLAVSIGAGLIVALFVFVALRWDQIIKGPISWSETERPIHHVRSIPDDTVAADYFAIRGTNNLSQPIKVKDAFVKSAVTGETFAGVVERIPAKNAEIQPYASFQALVHLGLPLDEFWKRLSVFTFVFETEKKTYEFSYGIDVTQKFLNDVASILRGSPGEKQSVLPSKVDS